MRNRALSLYVLVMAAILGASPNNNAQALIAAGGCTYGQCQSSCPSSERLVEFCEEYSLNAGCSISSAGCRPGADYGCGLHSVYTYCNESFVE